MKANLKPANAKARALFEKLQALVERGVDGERAAAQEKLAWLKARFDFGGAAPGETPDLFQGNFKRAGQARFVRAFAGDEIDIANAVKWAIESATKIRCVYRDGDLLAEATAATAKRLARVAESIARSFRSLMDKFGAMDGVSMADRTVFVMGLYDGMMNEPRNVGQALPKRPGSTKRSIGVGPWQVVGLTRGGRNGERQWDPKTDFGRQDGFYPVFADPVQADAPSLTPPPFTGEKRWQKSAVGPHSCAFPFPTLRGSGRSRGPTPPPTPPPNRAARADFVGARTTRIRDSTDVPRT